MKAALICLCLDLAALFSLVGMAVFLMAKGDGCWVVFLLAGMMCVRPAMDAVADLAMARDGE